MSHPGLSKLDELCVDAIRFLAADGVQKANSGHPGMPVAMAPAAYVLWTKHLRYNPANPKWHNRDRFVLSGGHGSMLLYSLLHLTGFDMSLEDLQSFRQWESKTPGHPEYDPELGVEATTGPLGQGISNAVGMAIAQKRLASHFNRDDFPVIDYKVYVFAGDGDLEEGISGEACSLAGHLGVNNLIVVYDDNHISIDGPTELSFSEDQAQRYEAYGWYVQEIDGDGNDMEAFERALINAKSEVQRPSIIKMRTHIAYGSPNMQDTAAAHGAPLGEDEIKLMKKKFGWDPEKTFHVPEEVADHMREALERGKEAEGKWNKMLEQYGKKHPDLAKAFADAAAGNLPVNLDEVLPKFKAGESLATRKASGKVLDVLMPHLPLVMGGSADLTPSNNTRFADAVDFQKDAPEGRYIRFGVREHAMGAILNGISISGLVRAYGGTFLVFSDYMRPAVRLAALGGLPVLYIWTHDSIALGEDGPTHQPVEHLASLRAVPNLYVFRPADANETAAAWRYALERRDGPTALVLSRQGLPVLDRARVPDGADAARGAYILSESDGAPQVLLLASGAEVHPTLDAQQMLGDEGIRARVVSMPSWEAFAGEDEIYREQVLPSAVRARVAVEAQSSLGWERWAGGRGIILGVDRFGASAPGPRTLKEYGFTAERIAQAARRSLELNRTAGREGWGK